MLPHPTLYFAMMLHDLREPDLFTFAHFPENISSLVNPGRLLRSESKFPGKVSKIVQISMPEG